MKKYFVAETEESCEFGDVLHLTFFKDIKDGKATVEKYVEFNEDTVSWMIEMGFVEEKEVEEEELPDFEGEEPCEALVQLIEDFEKQDKRIEILEAEVRNLKDYVKAISLNRAKEKKNDGNAKPQDK